MTDDKNLEDLIPVINPLYNPPTRNQLENNRRDYDRLVKIDKRHPAKIEPKRGTPEEIR